MSNLDVVKKIKKIYDPKTAFGNAELIRLLEEFVFPDEDGNFKVEGEIEEVSHYNFNWRCVQCGNYNEEENTDRMEGKKYEETCDCCKSNHIIQT